MPRLQFFVGRFHLTTECRGGGPNYQSGASLGGVRRHPKCPQVGGAGTGPGRTPTHTPTLEQISEGNTFAFATRIRKTIAKQIEQKNLFLALSQ